MIEDTNLYITIMSNTFTIANVNYVKSLHSSYPKVESGSKAI